MIRYKDLHIPLPCHKIHYDSLPYDPNKRPCHICEKPVYDFRDKDEVFLNQIWKKHKGNFCGAFRHNQFTEIATRKVRFVSLEHFRNMAAGFILSCWSFVAKAQDASNQPKSQTELLPSDNTKKSTDSTFMIMTKKCLTCEDEVRIDIYINNVYYNGYRVNDSTIISLPATIKPTDIITIKKYAVWNNGWTKSIDRVKEISFQFGEKYFVEIKGTTSTAIRFSYKRDWIGCPANFW